MLKLRSAAFLLVALTALLIVTLVREQGTLRPTKPPPSSSSLSEGKFQTRHHPTSDASLRKGGLGKNGGEGGEGRPFINDNRTLVAIKNGTMNVTDDLERVRRVKNGTLSDLGSYDRSGASARVASDMQSRKRLDAVSAILDARRSGDTVVFIHYHKTGSALSRTLAKTLSDEALVGVAAAFVRAPYPAYPKRRHDAVTKCPAYQNFLPKNVFVQAAPDLFCDDVASLFSDRRHDADNQTAASGGEIAASPSDDGGPPLPRRGAIKIIHLVRDPFDMVLSNYYYHAQVPSPEKWVFRDDPCEFLYTYDGNDNGDSNGTSFSDRKGDSGSNNANKSLADLVLPAISSVSHEQFLQAVSVCQSLYRTGNEPGLENAHFYNHLLKLDPLRGLRLATAQMIVSSGGETGAAGGDILRMANNIIRLERAWASSATSSGSSGQRRGLEILTMSMEEWLSHPRDSMTNMLDFVFRTGSGVLSERQKRDVSLIYEMNREKSGNSSAHVTQGKREKEDAINAFLRGDKVLGPILTAVEDIVKEALNETAKRLT